MTTTTSTRAQEFRDQLSRRVMVADGAMGTMLYSRGVFINRCFDELNLSLARHGARRSTRSTSRPARRSWRPTPSAPTACAWPPSAWPRSCTAINQAGVRLAREAASDSAFVAGAIGPLGVRIEPLGPTSFAEARAIFREQVEALLEAGVDLLILETFGDLDELREAIFAAREAAGRRDGRSSRRSPSTISATCPAAPIPRPSPASMDAWPVDVIGLNCSVGPKATLETIERMMQFTTKPISAMPNAGLPMRVEGRNIYLCSPEYMAQYARRLLWAGVQDHRRLLRHHARAHQADPLARRARCSPVHKKLAVTVEEPQAKAQALRQGAGGGKVASWAPNWPRASSSRSSRFCRRAAWMPPAKSPARSCCADAGIDCINVPDGPRASARMSAQVTCQLIQQQAGIEAVQPLLLPRPQHPGHPVANCWARTPSACAT